MVDRAEPAQRTRMTFALELPQASLAEYRRRHDQLWSELREAISRHGGHNFSLHYDAAAELVFGYLEVDDPHAWAAGADCDVTRRWWAYMADLMPTNPDNSPIGHELVEVFHHP